MFIGHFAVGFAAKKTAPAVSLGSLFLACQLALVVLSPWVLDVVSHRPDMPVTLTGLLAFLLLICFANFFSPPPPSTAAVAWTAQAMWLLVAWGYWIDWHRHLRQAPVTSPRTSSR